MSDGGNPQSPHERPIEADPSRATEAEHQQSDSSVTPPPPPARQAEETAEARDPESPGQAAPPGDEPLASPPGAEEPAAPADAASQPAQATPASDQGEGSSPPADTPTPTEAPAASEAPTSAEAASSAGQGEGGEGDGGEPAVSKMVEAARRAALRIKIGTQREGVEAPPSPIQPSHTPLAKKGPAVKRPPRAEGEDEPEDYRAKQAAEPIPGQAAAPPPKPAEKVPLPNLRESDDEIDAELSAALGEASVDQLVGPESGAPMPQHFVQGTRLQCKVLSIHDDNVFVDLGSRHQGVLAAKSFHGQMPEVGQPLEVVVQKIDPAEGLYHVGLPGSASDAGDWTTVSEGLLVEAVVSGTNKGGLECKVGGLRGFMPAGQVSIYRVENLDQLVGERIKAVITECNPHRKNLILSGRSAMEREREEARAKLMEELEVGAIREGVVRNLRDFGAFVDLGGVDALLHVREMAWTHVKHPKDLLQVGQRVKVKITKIDPESKRIGVSLRDLAPDPWSEVAMRFPIGETVTGRVTRTAQFGAFVDLGDGVEGLIHISELDNGRVWRVSDVVNVGDEVTVKVLSVENDRRRIALSRRAVLRAEAPPPKKSDEDDLPPEDDTGQAAAPKSNKPLKGGLDRPQGGEGLGLKL